MKWARDGFLAKDFDIVVLIELRSVLKKSLKKVIAELIGEEGLKQIMDTEGSKCLFILEGLDELSAGQRQTDPFLCSLLKRRPLLKEATVVITSRPHACAKLTVNRKIEVVGFGIDEIKEYVEKSLTSEPEMITKLLKQLEEYPHLLSICYVPMSLAMVVEIFSSSHLDQLPLTLTELYQQFIVMLLQREFSKDSVRALQQSSLVYTSSKFETVDLYALFEGVPKEATNVLISLSKLAFNGVFNKKITASNVKTQKDLKIIFTIEDLMQCGIKVTDQFDGFGLLKYTFSPEMAIGTYNFVHLTVQELLCALYISNLSQQEQMNLMDKYFDEHSNVFIFLCGITGLASSEMFQVVHSKLTSRDVVTALRCLYESKRKDLPVSTVSPVALSLSYDYILLPYDCLCISNALSYYSISSLDLQGCYIGDKGAELLVKYYSNESPSSHTLEKAYFTNNSLTTENGLIHVMKIAKIST